LIFVNMLVCEVSDFWHFGFCNVLNKYVKQKRGIGIPEIRTFSKS